MRNPIQVITVAALSMLFLAACTRGGGIESPAPLGVREPRISHEETVRREAYLPEEDKDSRPFVVHPDEPAQPDSYFEPTAILAGAGFEQAEELPHFLAGTYMIVYHPVNGDTPAGLFLRTLESAGQYEAVPEVNFSPSRNLLGTFAIGGHLLTFDEHDPDDVAVAREFLAATGFLVLADEPDFAPNMAYTIPAAIGVARDSKLVYGFSEDYLLAMGFSLNGSRPSFDGTATIETNEEMKKSVVIEGAVYQDGKKVSDYTAWLWSLDRYRRKR